MYFLHSSPSLSRFLPRLSLRAKLRWRVKVAVPKAHFPRDLLARGRSRNSAFYARLEKRAGMMNHQPPHQVSPSPKDAAFSSAPPELAG